MKRTTISMSDEANALLKHEARRRQKSVSALASELIEHGLTAPNGRSKKHRYSFIGIASGGGSNDAERMEEILREKWPAAIDRRS